MYLETATNLHWEDIQLLIPEQSWLKWVLLRVGLLRMGVNASWYSSHSFWIGAATTAAANEVSDATIQLMGQ